MNPGGDRCEYDHNIFSEIIKELLKIDLKILWYISLKNSLLYLPQKVEPRPPPSCVCTHCAYQFISKRKCQSRFCSGFKVGHQRELELSSLP